MTFFYVFAEFVHVRLLNGRKITANNILLKSPLGRVGM